MKRSAKKALRRPHLDIRVFFEVDEVVVKIDPAAAPALEARLATYPSRLEEEASLTDALLLTLLAYYKWGQRSSSGKEV